MNDDEILVQDIRGITRAFILSEFLAGEDSDSLSDETPLIRSGIVSSIGIMRLVSYLEQAYGITLELKEITVERFNTVADIVRTVEAKTKGR